MALRMLIFDTGPVTPQLRVPEIHHHKASKDAGIPDPQGAAPPGASPSSSSSYAV